MVDELVLRLEKMMGRLLGEDVAVVTRAEAEGATVWVDPGSLQQALMNLIFNARDAMPRGGTLALQAGVVDVDEARAAAAEVEEGAYAMIAVTDTGVGMDAHALAHVFEPFFTTRKEGTELGLSATYSCRWRTGLPATRRSPSPSYSSPSETRRYWSPRTSRRCARSPSGRCCARATACCWRRTAPRRSR